MKCTKEKFIRAWYESESKEEVAAKTGLSVNTVSRYCWQYRKKGIRLDKFKSESSREDMKKLVELSNVLAEKKETTVE